MAKLKQINRSSRGESGAGSVVRGQCIEYSSQYAEIVLHLSSGRNCHSCLTADRPTSMMPPLPPPLLPASLSRWPRWWPAAPHTPIGSARSAASSTPATWRRRASSSTTTSRSYGREAECLQARSGDRRPWRRAGRGRPNSSSARSAIRSTTSSRRAWPSRPARCSPTTPSRPTPARTTSRSSSAPSWP